MYRLDLKPPPLLIALIQPVVSLCPWIKARWPEWFLPPTVILKKRKADWEEEFEKEKQVYNVLKLIQGNIIPHFYGEAVYDGSPTLILSFIDGKTLFELRHDLSEDDLRQGLEKALAALTSYGVEYTDMKLDNFFMVDGGRVMVIDLEQVELDTTKVWEESVNRANVQGFMDILNIRRKLAAHSIMGA